VPFAELSDDTKEDLVVSVAGLRGEDEDEVKVGFENSDILVPVRQTQISKILADDRAVSAFTVKTYAWAMSQGDVFPPVTIVKEGSKFRLLEGGHRFMAARSLGAKTIAAFDLSNLQLVRTADGLETYAF
jgi:hypothetical protein